MQAIAALHAAGELPLSRLMIETDAPYMCPDKAWLPKFAKKGASEPAFTPAVCRALAAALGGAERGAGEEELARATTANARAFFGLERGSAEQ